MRHITGGSRQQATLLPDTLDDYVDEDHPVRVIDAFVDTLDMKALDFSKAETQVTGRKPYHPGDLLKLYVYGYLNQIRSSRRLEKECHRNLELLWLMRRLAPDFKTISDFRKDNGEAIRGACRTFIQFCRQADLLTGRLVAIDGSKFKAAASKDRVLTRKQLAEQRQRVDQLIEQYLSKLDKADEQDAGVELDAQRVQEALRRLEAEGVELDAIKAAMDEAGSRQYCATEPDAKLMRSGREGMVVGYNVQSAVDIDSGVVVHHDVNCDGADNRQLQPMAERPKTRWNATTWTSSRMPGIPTASSWRLVKPKELRPQYPATVPLISATGTSIGRISPTMPNRIITYVRPVRSCVTRPVATRTRHGCIHGQAAVIARSNHSVPGLRIAG